MSHIVLNEFDVADLKSKGRIEVKRLIKPQPKLYDMPLRSPIDYSFKFFTVGRTSDWLEPKYKVNGTYWIKMSYMQLMAMVGSRDIYKQFFTTKKGFNLIVTVADVAPLLENNKWYWIYTIKTI
jgi:hypothetical protein